MSIFQVLNGKMCLIFLYFLHRPAKSVFIRPVLYAVFLGNKKVILFNDFYLTLFQRCGIVKRITKL